MEVLKRSQMPWSDAVEALVQECLKLDHPRCQMLHSHSCRFVISSFNLHAWLVVVLALFCSVSLLQKQYELLQLKRMLQSYGVRDFNFSDTSKGYVSLCMHMD